MSVRGSAKIVWLCTVASLLVAFIETSRTPLTSRALELAFSRTENHNTRAGCHYRGKCTRQELGAFVFLKVSWHLWWRLFFCQSSDPSQVDYLTQLELHGPLRRAIA